MGHVKEVGICALVRRVQITTTFFRRDTMSTFQFTLNPYLTGPMGFQWDDSRILGHADAQLVKAARPPVFSWAVAHPAPRGLHWAPVTLHGTRKEAMEAAGDHGAVFQGSFFQPREGLVVARGRVYPAW